jgi:hypothetical protein
MNSSFHYEIDMTVPRTLLSYPGESQEIVSPLPLASSGKCGVNFELRMLLCDRALSFDSVLEGVLTAVNSRISFDLDSVWGVSLISGQSLRDETQFV